MKAITFDYSRPLRSDFRLIQASLRRGDPIPVETRKSLVVFCQRAALDGRTDRIVALARETLDMLLDSITKTVGKVS